MKRHFDEVITCQALKFKLAGCPGVFIEKKEDETEEETKNVCTPISLKLNEQVESVINLLDISKREFLRLAIELALERSSELVNELNVFEHEKPVDMSNVKSITLTDEEETLLESMTDEEKGVYCWEKFNSKHGEEK